jgi:hypothetical protein
LKVLIWKALSGRLHTTYQLAESDVTSIVVTNHGLDVVCGTVDGNIKVLLFDFLLQFLVVLSLKWILEKKD